MNRDTEVNLTFREKQNVEFMKMKEELGNNKCFHFGEFREEDTLQWAFDKQLPLHWAFFASLNECVNELKNHNVVHTLLHPKHVCVMNGQAIINHFEYAKEIGAIAWKRPQVTIHGMDLLSLDIIGNIEDPKTYETAYEHDVYAAGQLKKMGTKRCTIKYKDYKQ
jgi:hypothetical protein